jgi:hypothetical protein
MAMIKEYVHELNEEKAAICGYYVLEKEVRLKYNNREVLYVVGQGVVEASCCGTGGWLYAIVPGYVVGWQNKTNEHGLLVSEVEPISDGNLREKIRKIIKEKEGITQVQFW